MIRRVEREELVVLPYAVPLIGTAARRRDRLRGACLDSGVADDPGRQIPVSEHVELVSDVAVGRRVEAVEPRKWEIEAAVGKRIALAGVRVHVL